MLEYGEGVCMRGRVYGVGVGPGDPELMTLKGARVLREADVIAVPVKATDGDPAEALAYQIAVQAVPEISSKTLAPIAMPMTNDPASLEATHRAGADVIAALLDDGFTVAFLTLGDPSLYSTFSYLQSLLEKRDYMVEFISGVPSFCAAAARAGIPLALGIEQLHVIPANRLSADELAAEFSRSGTCILMKPSSNLAGIRDALRASGRDATAIERCGLEGERVYRGIEAIPDGLSYLSVIIVR